MDNSTDEKLLTLSDGRTLAYAANGNPSSPIVIINFHGALGVGRATRLIPVIKEYGAHYIAPTLPGWGNSTIRPRHTSYAANLLTSITELVNHVHPNQDGIRLYVAGGSFGTVPAQMLYGASFDAFPLGRKIVGCLIIAPFSPSRWHKDHAKSMVWQNYISVGPPAYYVPFRILPTLIAKLIKYKLSTVEATEKFIREELFDKAKDEEKAAFARWKEVEGRADGELEKELAENSIASIQKTTAGFIEIADVIHEDWGFRPDQLDEEHIIRRPILIVPSTEDDLGPDMAKWLEAKYRNSKLRWIQGGHIAAIYESGSIWREFLETGESQYVPGSA